MLHRFTNPDGTTNQPAMFDGFAAIVRHAMRTVPGFTVGEHMDTAWKRVLDETAAEKAGFNHERGRGASMPFSFDQLFGIAFVATDPVAARRARLLRFVKLMDDTDPRRLFRLRLGDAVIRYESLTDDALEDISADMVAAFWRLRRMNRENRAVYARRQAERAQAAEQAA